MVRGVTTAHGDCEESRRRRGAEALSSLPLPGEPHLAFGFLHRDQQVDGPLSLTTLARSHTAETVTA